ncbi:MAG: 3-isopropylmalate dehydratase small subunit [Actinobacteria bacterium]|nr:3-isopropylmalate dehydratase small subunit [Actinomycetota bacterium]
MDKFIAHSGTAIPLRRSNVDTDQIIPAVYLKRITKSGFEDGLFAAWRSDPNFELNQSKYQGASILVAGPDFGTGSSREHAVWALQNYGFKVVLSSRFADIFRGNSQKAGLLTVILAQNEIEDIWLAIEKDSTTQITVDLNSRSVEFKDATGNQRKLNFEIDDYTRWRLMEGLDDIGLTFTKIDKVENFEKSRQGFKPQTIPVKS